MGAVISTDTEIQESVFIRRFVGLESISDNDPFWNHFFSFNLRIDDISDKMQLKQFDTRLAESLQSLMYNTPTTGNLAAFVRVLLRRASELRSSEICRNTIFLWQISNALIVLRIIYKFMVQRLSEAEFISVFDKHSSANRDSPVQEDDEADLDNMYESKVEELLDTLIDILVDLPVNNSTELIHIEAVKCCIVLLSSQLYHENVLLSNAFYASLMHGKCSTRSLQLSKVLLNNYLQRSTPYAAKRESEPQSIVLGFATSMWSALQLVAGMDDQGSQSDPENALPISLGSLSVLLLLNLACHHCKAMMTNSYKESLANFQNSQEVSSLGNNEDSSFKIDYNALYERICATAKQQPPMLLLYLVLHRNIGFRNYVLSRINLEKLVIPVLIVLHDGTHNTAISASHNSHHVYLALIVILILSEDDFFCKVAHETIVNNTSWFASERPFGEVTLGDMIVLVFTRTIQCNTTRTKDKYLHTNCLAALANMSSHFKNLSPIACQRLIGLLDLLTRRHMKLIESMRVRAEYDIMPEKESQNYHHDITALEEGIRTLLEICNCCLTSNLRYNPHFIYTILYQRELFDRFQNHPMFQDLIWNICTVINHFASRVQSLEKGASVSAVLKSIERGALQWPTDRLKKFPQLKFKYIEDDNTVEFFVPYVWRLTFQFSSIYWDPTRIRLFNAMLLS